MDSNSIRDRSLSLFNVIKPICVGILTASNDSTVSDATIVHHLRALSIALDKSLSAHTAEEYIISTKLADYIFVPLANLLKLLTLLNEAIRYILRILAFLLNQSWSHNIDVALLDQLSPLIVFLSGGSAVGTSKSAADSKLPEFVHSATKAIEAMLNCVPRSYYTGKDISKRLSVLGDSTTILLEFLQVIDASSEEAAQSILQTLASLYSTRVSAEQASFVFPGLVSKVINFYLNTKNLHSPTIVSIVNLLRQLAIRVFADDTLVLTKSNAPLYPESAEFLEGLLDDESKVGESDFRVLFHIKDSPGIHRTDSWLRATSKQFKLSLMAFVKALLLGPNSKTRIVPNKKIANSIMELVSDIIRKCFKSLYRELLFVTVDIVSALYHASTESGQYEDPDSLQKIVQLYSFSRLSELELLLPPLLHKTEDFISSQLESALSLMSEEKLSLCFSAVLVHIHIGQEILQALMKPPLAIRMIKELALKVVAISLKQSMGSSTQKRTISNDQYLGTASGKETDEDSNTLDSILLPPQIDARKVSTFKANRSQNASLLNVSFLQQISFDIDSKEIANSTILLQVYSRSAEKQIQLFLRYFGLSSENDLESFTSVLLHTNSTSTELEIHHLSGSCVSLWIANNLFKNAPPDSSKCFNLNEFLDFDVDEELQRDQHDADYMLLDAAKQLIYDSQEFLDSNEGSISADAVKSCEILRAVALESIGLLAARFSKDDFQTEILIDYLYPLLEAFAQSPESLIHLHAKLALKRISDARYHGSLQELVIENADYLIDSLSVKFSTSSGLTPALSGILLVVLKISGVQLLRSNQLQDIIAEIFIAIDAYHGYSVLVENFFVVFQEIIIKVKELYKRDLEDCQKLEFNKGVSAYKPWGVESIDKLFDLIKDNEDRVELPTGFDPKKEYFRKNPGAPFSEVDSDDEEEDAEDQARIEEEPQWESFIAKNLYSSVEQIFKYGCQMLTHPSTKLKLKVLRTMREAYPILATNYRLLMLILAEYFPVLLALSAGSSTLSAYYNERPEPQNQFYLIVPTLELLQVIIAEDLKHEKFMSSRFIELWTFLKERSPIIAGIVEQDRSEKSRSKLSKEPASLKIASIKISARIKQLYSLILLSGLNTYERTVPGLIAHEIVRVCSVLGVDDTIDLGKDVRNHLWVLRNC